MKAIDKTGMPARWTYGTVLKCWDDDPQKYYLYRISDSHSLDDDDKYEVDTLHDPEDNDMIWSTFFYDDVRDIKEELENAYTHVVPVKASIVIEDL